MIASGMAPASAPAKAVKGSRAVAQKPLPTHKRVKRWTTGFGILGGCRAIRRRTDAAPTEEATESRRRAGAGGIGTLADDFGFFHSHSFLYIVLTGICLGKKNIELLCHLCK